jgi:hypothetical protein
MWYRPQPMKKQNPKQRQKTDPIPRQVRMPLDLDEWLEAKAAADSLPKTVADKIREIVAEARDKELREQGQAA